MNGAEKLALAAVYSAWVERLLRASCGATDGLGVVSDDPGEAFGRCNLRARHPGDWHQETRDGEVWATWRGPRPGQKCGICSKDGAAH